MREHRSWKSEQGEGTKSEMSAAQNGFGSPKLPALFRAQIEGSETLGGSINVQEKEGEGCAKD